MHQARLLFTPAACCVPTGALGSQSSMGGIWLAWCHHGWCPCLFRAVPNAPGNRLTIQRRFFEPGIQMALGSLESRKRGHSTEQLGESFAGEFWWFCSSTCNVAGTGARTLVSTVTAGNGTSLKGMWLKIVFVCVEKRGIKSPSSEIDKHCHYVNSSLVVCL